MREIIDYKRQEVPARYELSWESPLTLVVRVRSDLIPELAGMNWEHAWVPHFRKSLGLGEFAPPSTKIWGFGGSIRTTTHQWIGWTTWKCDFPVLYEPVSDSSIYDLRATLCMLWSGLSLVESNPHEGDPQLITIDNLAVRPEMNGGAMHASVTPAMVRWLAPQPVEMELTPVAKAMREAHDYMWPDKKFQQSNHFFIQAHTVHHGGVRFTAARNDGSFDPDPNRVSNPGQGYQLSTHHVDSGLHQLTLLAGLAKLHDLARGK